MRAGAPLASWLAERRAREHSPETPEPAEPRRTGSTEEGAVVRAERTSNG